MLQPTVLRHTLANVACTGCIISKENTHPSRVGNQIWSSGKIVHTHLVEWENRSRSLTARYLHYTFQIFRNPLLETLGCLLIFTLRGRLATFTLDFLLAARMLPDPQPGVALCWRTRAVPGVVAWAACCVLRLAPSISSEYGFQPGTKCPLCRRPPSYCRRPPAYCRRPPSYGRRPPAYYLVRLLGPRTPFQSVQNVLFPRIFDDFGDSRACGLWLRVCPRFN